MRTIKLSSIITKLVLVIMLFALPLFLSTLLFLVTGTENHANSGARVLQFFTVISPVFPLALLFMLCNVKIEDTQLVVKKLFAPPRSFNSEELLMVSKNKYLVGGCKLIQLKIKTGKKKEETFYFVSYPFIKHEGKEALELLDEFKRVGKI